MRDGIETRLAPLIPAGEKHQWCPAPLLLFYSEKHAEATLLPFGYLADPISVLHYNPFTPDWKTDAMIDKQALLQALNFRHACKTFDPTRKIPDGDFHLILEAGRLSPSSFGFEPWRFLVVQDMSLREKLRAVSWGAQGQFPTASHVIALLARKEDMRPESDYTEHMMRDVIKMSDEAIARRHRFYPQFMETDFHLQEPRALFDWSCRQAYIALANMMTAAALIDIDSCPIEGFNQEKAEAVLAEAGLLEDGRFGLAVMVAFGYRVNPQPVKTRQAMEQVVRWV
jgi:nitroreductase